MKNIFRPVSILIVIANSAMICSMVYRKLFTALTLPAMILTALTLPVFSQGMDEPNPYTDVVHHIDNVAIPENDAEHPCISVAEYELIEARIEHNLQTLNLKKNSNNYTQGGLIKLDWPLRASPLLKDCSYYYIAAYVDQDYATGSVKDFNCGSITYDGHRGTDISTWPFNFYKMDNDLVEVVAAAPGFIVDKHDGAFDKNCSANSLTANYVVVQHNDGSRAMYWHMKKGSVTKKLAGEAVNSGDYLGVVGASGSASGPHLHFESWSGSTVEFRIDPYSGPCNTLNSASRWNAQKPYKETEIVRATVHSTDIVIPTCPATETVNQSTVFIVPFQGSGLAPGYAKFYVFIRNEISGLTAEMKIVDQQGFVADYWTLNSSADNKVRTVGFSKKLPTTTGKYEFQATYNGKTCSSAFEIKSDAPNSVFDKGASWLAVVFASPTTGQLTIDFGDGGCTYFQISNVMGQVIEHVDKPPSTYNTTISTAPGLYFYQLKTFNGEIKNGTFFVQH
ncbi:MAG: M23 family metallopeptidase [Ignavibacteria bacterium]|nr:M23 family metallopeptidase [Ignavibacteria bacterium]